MSKPIAVAVFSIWTLAFVFGVYVWTTGKTKGFGYLLAVWLGPFIVAGALAALIAWDQSY